MKISDLEKPGTKLSDETADQWIKGIKPIEREMSASKVFVDEVYQGIKTHQRFGIITMCGSTRFKNEYMEMVEQLTYAGWLVLLCPIFHHADKVLIPENKTQLLKDIHRQRIRMADAIFVVNKGGYIGNNTREEIEYAESLEKHIFYMEDIEE